MTAKIILSMDGMVLNEFPLSKERVMIGRKSGNDIVIDNLAVSGEHAAIVTILQDSFLEDLDSTNGLLVNGVETKKHFLQNNDVIEIGKHTLRYVTDHVSQTSAADFEKTMVLRGPVKHVASVVAHTSAGAQEVAVSSDQTSGGYMNTQVMQSPPPAPAVEVVEKTVPPVQAAAVKTAVVQILTGPNAGKELELVKSLTTLGKPGVQVAVLARRPQGFFITHVEGTEFPLVNGQSLSEQTRELSDHDLIDLAGVKMEFFYKG